MSKLPVRELLEAAHIIPDWDVDGVAEINNGVCLSRIHHRAYDANLISIDADYKIHISHKLLEIIDGPLLETGLKALNGNLIDVPVDPKIQPNRDLLDRRHFEFSQWAW
jgi:putative restriction endonuclease